jgi:hypothetical protein
MSIIVSLILFNVNELNVMYNSKACYVQYFHLVLKAIYLTV